MFHRIGKGKHTNSLEILRSHFSYLKEHYPVVLPGDPLKKFSVCLTFDDAFFDFYHYVFPLLKEFNLRALLGVPVRYIVEKTTLSPEERLNVPYPLAMQDGFFDQKVPFCTWEELREMSQSGHVEVACHSFSHANLTFPFVKLEREVVLSKKILEEQLGKNVTSFVYPFGRYNSHVHQFISEHFRYIFRIGSAWNRSWDCKTTPLKRIPSDGLITSNAPFTLTNRTRYFLKSFF